MAKRKPKLTRKMKIQMSLERGEHKEYKCSPTCPYFPNMECRTGDWYIDPNGIKRRADKKAFICGYDGHTITSWYDECPRIIDLIKEKEIYCYYDGRYV